jgi:hypothetical protein
MLIKNGKEGTHGEQQRHYYYCGKEDFEEQFEAQIEDFTACCIRLQTVVDGACRQWNNSHSLSALPRYHQTLSQMMAAAATTTTTTTTTTTKSLEIHIGQDGAMDVAYLLPCDNVSIVPVRCSRRACACLAYFFIRDSPPSSEPLLVKQRGGWIYSRLSRTSCTPFEQNGQQQHHLNNDIWY